MTKFTNMQESPAVDRYFSLPGAGSIAGGTVESGGGGPSRRRCVPIRTCDRCQGHFEGSVSDSEPGQGEVSDVYES